MNLSRSGTDYLRAVKDIIFIIKIKGSVQDSTGRLLTFREAIRILLFRPANLENVKSTCIYSCS